MADTVAAEKLPSSMCFLEAWAARHYEKISGEEYYRHVFAHLTGTFHKADETDEDVRMLKRNDPFAYSVLDSAKKMGRIEEDIKARVDGMQESRVPYALRMLAMQALLDRRPGILKICLDRGGFEYESNFVDRANTLNEEKDPETFKVFQESNFRKLHPRRQHPAFATDVGGKYPVDW
ncbi:hypothetical protein UCREL1_7166 [Eutypa lata UCREL1]|uniref:Uncharacterized protein n=1 Tax=Eutypa lata (strain UCR-EL1) TaxID=1287681 RepID=M7SNR5_EUTLA|nr:hypothetical protein UCREL1_7166 [Eutypa lata UCREL1]